MAGELTDEIRAMFQGGTDPNEGENNGEGEEEQRDQVQTEAEGQELLGAEGEDAGAEPPPPPASAEPPEETLEERYARLLTELNDKNARLLELEAGIQRTEPAQPAAQTPEPTTQLPPVPMQIQRPTFQFDIEKLKTGLIEDDAEAVGQVLQGFIDYANRLVDHTRESIYLSIPEIADKVAAQRTNLMIHINKFYEANPDLQAHRATCGVITNEVVAENPNQTLDNVFLEVSKRVRQKLGIKRTIQDADQNSDRSNPGFAKRAGSRKPGAPQLSGVKADIAAMSAVIGR